MKTLKSKHGYLLICTDYLPVQFYLYYANANSKTVVETYVK